MTVIDPAVQVGHGDLGDQVRQDLTSCVRIQQEEQWYGSEGQAHRGASCHRITSDQTMPSRRQVARVLINPTRQ